MRVVGRGINKMRKLHKKIARQRLKWFYRRVIRSRIVPLELSKIFEDLTHTLHAPRKKHMPDTGRNAAASTLSKRYHYQPLESNENIRILTLHPGKPGDQLVGTIDVVSIHSAVPYETMSYVWADSGPLKHAGTMMIRRGGNEDALLVLRGRSVVAALQQLRLPDRPRRIWTDQCCIDQDDLDERSMQVQLMDQIYRESTHVLVWLGSDTKNEAALAFDIVRKLDKILEEIPADDRCDRQKKDLVSYVTENQQCLRALTNCKWVSLQAKNDNSLWTPTRHL